MTRLLALDLGTTTGFAIGDVDKRPVSGSVSFKPGRFEGGGMRFVRFRNWLAEIGQAEQIDQVAFEEVRRHKATDAAHVYGGLMATLTEWCEVRKIPYEGIPVGAIKRHWAGKGNASKPQMIEAAMAKGFYPADDNEADALAIFDFVVSR